VHKIVTKARQLVDVKKDDGFAALHLAALNGHLRTAETLIDVVRNLFLFSVFSPLANFPWLFIWQACFCWLSAVIPHPLKSLGVVFLISRVPFSMCKQQCQCITSAVCCIY